MHWEVWSRQKISKTFDTFENEVKTMLNYVGELHLFYLILFLFFISCYITLKIQSASVCLIFFQLFDCGNPSISVCWSVCLSRYTFYSYTSSFVLCLLFSFIHFCIPIISKPMPTCAQQADSKRTHTQID